MASCALIGLLLYCELGLVYCIHDFEFISLRCVRYSGTLFFIPTFLHCLLQKLERINDGLFTLLIRQIEGCGKQVALYMLKVNKIAHELTELALT